MIVWANVVPNRAVIKSDWIKFRQSVHLVILLVKVSCSTSVDGIKNSIQNQCTPTQYTKRRDLGVGEGWEEELKCVDGGGDEEKQNNCEIVRIEKRKHQILPLQTMNQIPFKRRVQSFPAIPFMIYFLRGRLYLFTLSGDRYQNHLPRSRTKRIRNFADSKW